MCVCAPFFHKSKVSDEIAKLFPAVSSAEPECSSETMQSAMDVDEVSDATSKGGRVEPGTGNDDIPVPASEENGSEVSATPEAMV